MGKKQKQDKDTITVYWSAQTDPQHQTYSHLLWGQPVPLIKTMPVGSKYVNANYRTCVALNESIKNTYTFIHPITHSVTLSGEFESPTIQAEVNAWIKRPSALKDSYSIDYDFGWFFFSEESLKVKVTPPYFHNTSSARDALISTGSFDISKWFRAFNLAYMLWPNNNTLTVTKGEPAFYIEFVTDKKIILKQFECTEEILNFSNQVITASRVNMIGQTLKYRYDRFFETNRHKRILKLIKENLLD